MSDRESYFAEAERLVNGDRQADYGHPIDNHTETGAAWSAYLRRRFDLPALELDAEDVCMLNVLQKVIRDANSRKRDNRVDAIGYLRNVEMVEQERARRASRPGRVVDGGGLVRLLSHRSTKETERSLDTRRFSIDETACEYDYVADDLAFDAARETGR